MDVLSFFIFLTSVLKLRYQLVLVAKLGLKKANAIFFNTSWQDLRKMIKWLILDPLWLNRQFYISEENSSKILILGIFS